MGEDPKEEGPAEEAPEEEQQPQDLEPLGAYAGQSRRNTQVVQIDGYLRLRTDFLHKLHLDQTYITRDAGGTGGQAPARLAHPALPGAAGVPIEHGPLRVQEPGQRQPAPAPGAHHQHQRPGSGGGPGGRPGQHHHGLHARRSLPAARRPHRPGAPALYTTQDPPEIGRNSIVSSVRAKRAWGEVDSEFGSLRFGRMPWHFGRGIAFNNGNCPDCEGGTTVDRIMGLTQLYGHQFALSWDLAPRDTRRHDRFRAARSRIVRRSTSPSATTSCS